MLEQVRTAVSHIGTGKKFVLVDGVGESLSCGYHNHFCFVADFNFVTGYPAVGSICSISNADVAKAIGAPVLIVGKSGQ